MWIPLDSADNFLWKSKIYAVKELHAPKCSSVPSQYTVHTRSGKIAQFLLWLTYLPEPTPLLPYTIW